MAENQADWYRILGMFKENGEKIDWIPRAPKLSSLYGFGLPHGDARGFIYKLKRGERVYIIAVKVHASGLLPQRIEYFTGWGLIGQQIGGFPLVSENVPNEVKRAAEAYLLDWLGWFGGKQYAKDVTSKSKMEWKSIPCDDPVNEETKRYFTM